MLLTMTFWEIQEKINSTHLLQTTVNQYENLNWSKLNLIQSMSANIEYVTVFQSTFSGLQISLIFFPQYNKLIQIIKA